LVFLHAFELYQSIFPLIETHSIIFWAYWSSVMHILIILFVVFLPAGLSFSLFLYWSLCPHSWYQSHFLQVHFKGIASVVFHSQENRTDFFAPAIYVHLADLIWLLVSIFKNFNKGTFIFTPFPYSLFHLMYKWKEGFHIKSTQNNWRTQKKKGSILIMSCSHTSFGYDHLRTPERDSASWIFKRRAQWESRDVVRSISGDSVCDTATANLPFWRSYVCSVVF
jgi:hypothetical protein